MGGSGFQERTRPHQAAPGRQAQSNCRGVIKKDLWRMGLTWEEAYGSSPQQTRLALECGNVSTWTVHMDTGWIKVKVMNLKTAL